MRRLESTLEPEEEGGDDARAAEGEEEHGRLPLSLHSKAFFGMHPHSCLCWLCRGPREKALEYPGQPRPVENGERWDASPGTRRGSPAGSASLSHPSQAFLAVGIGIGPGRVPQVKGAPWVRASFLVEAAARPQAQPRSAE